MNLFDPITTRAMTTLGINYTVNKMSKVKGYIFRKPFFSVKKLVPLNIFKIFVLRDYWKIKISNS